VAAAREIAEQFDTEAPNAIVHASGTGGTQAGLVAGSCQFLPTTDIVGIDIDAEPQRVRSDVLRLTDGLSRRLGLNENLDDRIDVVAGFSGPAYGTPTPDMLEAITMFARLEGLVLDPVYSGKGAAGLIGLIRSGRFTAVDTVVFLHTGGSPGLFAYREVVADYLASGGYPPGSDPLFGGNHRHRILELVDGEDRLVALPGPAGEPAHREIQDRAMEPTDLQDLHRLEEEVIPVLAIGGLLAPVAPIVEHGRRPVPTPRSDEELEQPGHRSEVGDESLRNLHDLARADGAHLVHKIVGVQDPRTGIDPADFLFLGAAHLGPWDHHQGLGEPAHGPILSARCGLWRRRVLRFLRGLWFEVGELSVRIWALPETFGSRALLRNETASGNDGWGRPPPARRQHDREPWPPR
jgi:hypothetical protein